MNIIICLLAAICIVSSIFTILFAIGNAKGIPGRESGACGIVAILSFTATITLLLYKVLQLF